MRAFNFSRVVGLVALLAALVFTTSIHFARVRHVQQVSAIGEQSLRIDHASKTGLSGETRSLIVPAHHRESYDWIVQTQEMYQRSGMRIHEVDYENAPYGRMVYSTSPYHRWLALVARVDRLFSGRPVGLSVEHAALYSDPARHLLFLLLAFIFVAWQFGWSAAALVAIGIAGLFPFAAGFLAGAPDDLGFAAIASFWSVLLLVPGIRAIHSIASSPPAIGGGSRAGPWFVIAGIAGGCAIWISVRSQMPVLIGIALGGLASAIVARSARPGSVTDADLNRTPHLWRLWGTSGAVTVLIAYLIEFFPSHLGQWELGTIHPLYCATCLALGELLAFASSPKHPAVISPSLRQRGRLALAILGIAAVPLTMWLRTSAEFLPLDGSAYQLTRLPDGITAHNLWHWLTRGALDTQLLATLAPILILVPATWWAFRRTTRLIDRAALAFALGPCFVAGGFACAYLSTWHLFDALALTLIVLGGTAQGTSGRPILPRGVWCGVVLAALLPGIVRLWPRADALAANAAPLLEVEGVIERDLARWMAKRIGDPRNAIVWAPPDVTNTLYFYGGLRGIGTFAPENADGLAASFQLARAGAHEEALALVRRRGITHVVLPSWDPFFADDPAQSPTIPPAGFLSGLQRWVLPPWLRPVPYQLSPTAKVENYSVQVFEVVDEQEPSIALSRLAEFFAEIGDLSGAAWVDESLQRFPADISALTARAHVLTARGETAGYTRVMDTLKLRLRSKADRFLAWDRRVSLAIALAREQDIDRAREQTQRCLAEINEAGVRSLSPGMLLNFQLLVSALELEIVDPRLRDLAEQLLPEELQRHLR